MSIKSLVMDARRALKSGNLNDADRLIGAAYRAAGKARPAVGTPRYEAFSGKARTYEPRIAALKALATDGRVQLSSDGARLYLDNVEVVAVTDAGMSGGLMPERLVTLRTRLGRTCVVERAALRQR